VQPIIVKLQAAAAKRGAIKRMFVSLDLKNSAPVLTITKLPSHFANRVRKWFAWSSHPKNPH